MPYSDDEMLLLSGIQHYCYCPRQWGLIHIEQAWEENTLTFEGRLLHTHADQPAYRNKQGEMLSLHAVNVASHTLGIYGIMDILELYPSRTRENTISHPKYPGNWVLYPVEYKHGKAKENKCDEVQLMAQALCLEEMYGISIPEGAIYYNETRRRTKVEFTASLRSFTLKMLKEMHRIYDSQQIPPPPDKKSCGRCSLKELCQPDFFSLPSTKSYLLKNLYEETS